MIAVLVFLLVGCDDTWFGVPRDGPIPAGDGGSGGATARYHPDGYADPSQHGGAAKASAERCVSCHGEDLTGEGDALSCDTCHAEGWRTDCTRCHGGTDDASGAPPRYIAGGEEGALATFWSHTPHGSGELGAAVSCGTCHVVPTDVLSDGHLFLGDRTPAEAEVDLAGLGAGGLWNGEGCSNVYCHGTGQAGATGSVEATAEDLDCGSCHAGPDSSFAEWGDRMSGKHFLHLGEGIACSECHADSVDDAGTILDPASHVDGVANLRLPTGMEVVGEQDGLPVCAGVCHVNDHPHLPDRLWIR